MFDLLHLLLRSPGVLVSRDRIMETVWNGRIVSEAAVDARISGARKAVGDDGKSQRIIRTVPRRGIQLVCQVESAGSPETPGAKSVPEETQRVRFAQSADGVHLAFATTGQGPPLVRGGHWLTHLELDWQSPVWRPLMDALGRDNAVTRWDQRGTGLSDRGARQFDLDVMAGDLEAVADAAGLNRFSIFAASQAAPVAIRFAARHPERVSHLVLYGGFAMGRAIREGPEAEAQSEAFQVLVRAGWGRPDSAFIRAFSTIYMPDATQEQLDSFVEMQLASASPETAADLRAQTGYYDVRPDLEKIRPPTLVIHARQDSVAPLSQGQMLAAGIPQAEFLVLESRNHIPLPQDPAFARMVDATLEFLERDRTA